MISAGIAAAWMPNGQRNPRIFLQPRIEVTAFSASDGSTRPGGSLPKWKTIGRSKNTKDEDGQVNGRAATESIVEIEESGMGLTQEPVVSSAQVFVKEPSSPHLFAYPEGTCPASVVRLETDADVADELANLIESFSRDAVENRGVFSIVLSGGSLVKALQELPGKAIDWGKWHVFWADERVVPLTHEDSNFKAAQDLFLSRVPIPATQIHTIEENVSATMAAEAYESNLQKLVADGVLEVTAGSRYPRFDLVLLGLGPDGHVASLFPNSPLLGVKGKWVLPVENSPKPPPQRITLTLPALNSAKNVVFVATGKGKAFVVERTLERAALPGSLPAQLVRPYSGAVSWLLDAAAASDLETGKWEDARSFPYIDFR